MPFQPSIHGWPFGNSHVLDPATLGLGRPPIRELGLGGGLCWSALDRYLRGSRIPRDTPEPEEGDALHTELVRRQVAALSGVWRKVEDWQGRPDGSWRERLPLDLRGGRDLASVTRNEWQRSQARIDRDRPVLLTLLPHADPYRRARAAWQVLATGWRREDGRIAISVYDPARPDDDDVWLSFATTGPLAARLTGGRPVRAFFAVPYDREPAEPVRAESFADRSVLGLNRPVSGGLAPASGSRRLDLVARNAEGALLHFQRAKGRSWEGSNVTEREGLGSHELHSDPAALTVGSTLHVFARGYVGDLLHFRLARGWKATNLTDQKRVGPRFRLGERPVAVTRARRISVLGRDDDGALIHYTDHPVLGWRAEVIDGPALHGPLTVVRGDEGILVAGRTRDGDVILHEQMGEGWASTNLTTSATGADAPRLVGRPVLWTAGPETQLLGRDAEDRLVAVRRGERGGWVLHVIAAGVSGDPAATTGPAGLHVFIRTADRGLLHAWHATEWHAEPLTSERPALARVRLDHDPACWGSSTELRVYGRQDDDLWLIGWRADADWQADRLSEREGVLPRHRPGDDPVVVEDARGRPHLFLTDGSGSVVHVEPGDWQEPGSTTPEAPGRTPTLHAPEAAVASAAEVEPAAAQEQDSATPVAPEPEPVAAELDLPGLYVDEPAERATLEARAEPVEEPARPEAPEAEEALAGPLEEPTETPAMPEPQVAAEARVPEETKIEEPAAEEPPIAEPLIAEPVAGAPAEPAEEPTPVEEPTPQAEATAPEVHTAIEPPASPEPPVAAEARGPEETAIEEPAAEAPPVEAPALHAETTPPEEPTATELSASPEPQVAAEAAGPETTIEEPAPEAPPIEEPTVAAPAEPAGAPTLFEEPMPRAETTAPAEPAAAEPSATPEPPVAAEAQGPEETTVEEPAPEAPPIEEPTVAAPAEPAGAPTPLGEATRPEAQTAPEEPAAAEEPAALEPLGTVEPSASTEASARPEDPKPAEAPAGEAGEAGEAETPRAPAAHEASDGVYRWSNGTPPEDGEIEPMDLSLLDTWPKAPPSLRKHREGEEKREREAS